MKAISEMAFPEDNGSGRVSLGRTMIDCKLLFKLDMGSQMEDFICTLVLSSENREADREEEKKQSLEEGVPIRFAIFLDQVHKLIARMNAELFMDPDQMSKEQKRSIDNFLIQNLNLQHTTPRMAQHWYQLVPSDETISGRECLLGFTLFGQKDGIWCLSLIHSDVEISK